MFDWILISLGTIIVLPILVYLCMKLGTVGFYRGKEVWKKQNEFNNVQNNNNENES